MRPAQKSNRSRGRGNRNKGGGGGGGGGININRVYDSSGPEGKVRGTPQQIIDKYLSLSRDAQTSDDRVMEQSFLQHAEHYQRILTAAMGAQEQARREANAQNNDTQQHNQQHSQQQHAQGHPGQAQPAQGQPAADGRPASPAPEQPAANIGGMAMIDSGPAHDSLLVDAPEAVTNPPQANGENRRRRRKPEPASTVAEKPAKPAEPDASEVASPETAAEG